jgi:hypothetical protein
MNTLEKLSVWVKIVFALTVGFLTAYPVYLYGRHFLIH